jgi:hypothetical protein
MERHQGSGWGPALVPPPTASAMRVLPRCEREVGLAASIHKLMPVGLSRFAVRLLGAGHS